MKLRKLTALLLTVLFVLVSMAGCGGCAGTESGAAGSSLSQSESLSDSAGESISPASESSSSAPAETPESASAASEKSSSAASQTSLPQTPASASSAAPAASSSSSSTSSTSSSKDSGITFTDMTGRQVYISSKADRIVALEPSDCEILCAIGAGDYLVGRGEYCDYPASVSSVQSVQSGYNTNIEQIIALKPDILVMTKMGQTENQVAQLEKAGITVVVSDAQDIDGVYDAITMLGRMTGKNAAAKNLIKSMKSDFAAVEANAGNNSGKSVYFEVSPLQYGLWTAGRGTFMDEIAEMLGLENCFHDVDGWAQISEEQVIARNPDYIVTISMYYGTGPTPVEEVSGRSGWENVTAVADGAILNLYNNELSRPGPRLAEGAKKLNSFIVSCMNG